MRLMITNDDGIDARGLHVLVEAMTRLDGDHEIVVIAPDDEWSGASASIGALFKTDPKIRRWNVPGTDVEAWMVHGPPGLCALFARLGAFGDPFDLIVSGINPGANVGRSIYHSGTVGAAVTGRNGGVPGIAFSQAIKDFSAWGQTWDELVENLDFRAAAEVARTMVQALVDDLPDEAFVLNVNVPEATLENLKGWKQTEVGVAPPRESQKASLAPVEGDEGAFHVEMDWGEALHLDPLTDAGAIDDGYVSVTNLSRFTHVPRADLDPLVGALDGLLHHDA